MEFVFNLLKHLSEALTSFEFFILIAILCTFAFGIVRFLLKMAGKKGVIADMMRTDKNSIDDVADKLDNIVTKEIHVDSLNRILRAVEELKEETNQNDEAIQTQITDILLLKKDVEILSDNINKEINELKLQLKMYDSHNHHFNDSVKEILYRLQDLIQRILSQIDKIDEFTRAAIPEFRSYHMELSKEVSELNRDIALVERTINTQINNSSSINLR